MTQNIMLAFVSPVNARSLSEPIKYGNIQGREYSAIQTNESAIVFVERKLEAAGDSLSKIFLIASDYVKNNPVPAENEFGNVTHLEFLKRRVTKEFPHLSERFSIEDYSEEGKDPTKLERNILQIARIADAMTEFAKGAELTVHADMTGGFRHTSMLMLSIIQLLKYRGVKIGEILYSEPTSRVVYRVTEIQRMFTLITGADEFVKFGSVEALNEYFGEKPPPAVKTLLEAMNRFSEAIKICRTSAIETELKNLGEHIKEFRAEPDKDLKSELFAKIIDTIEREYGQLIGGAESRAEIIRWCMRKGFWQQAMTLCTEWLPEELVERKICVPNGAGVIKRAEQEGRSFGRNWQQQFIIAYQGRDKSNETVVESAVKNYCRNLREVLRNFPKQKLSDENCRGELKEFFAEYETSRYRFELSQRRKIAFADFKKRSPRLAAVLQTIYDERKANPIYHKNFYEFLRTMNYEIILLTIAGFSNVKLLEMFKIEFNALPVAKVKPPVDKSESKWENREKIYRELFEKKIIATAFDEETALKFLKDYYEIRRERNQVNHANAQATKTISDLKPMIENYLTALEKIPAT